MKKLKKFYNIDYAIKYVKGLEKRGIQAVTFEGFDWGVFKTTYNVYMKEN